MMHFKEWKYIHLIRPRKKHIFDRSLRKLNQFWRTLENHGYRTRKRSAGIMQLGHLPRKHNQNSFGIN